MSKDLNTVVREEWVKALRSGEYRQCRGKRHDKKGRHCAVGVLEVVYKSLTGEDLRGIYEYADKLSGIDPLDELTYSLHSVDELNDNGKSFKEIADYIEELTS